uniref:PX domain-containing protein n=1 Tax=Denticeps clupeoides TaxID=299321 RepID=A0AAY4CB17_9TELE
ARMCDSRLMIIILTVYIIEVTIGDHKWSVKHRYSDFHDLHEKLTTEKKLDKHLLPPKKIIGKNSKSLVEKRQKELEVYLQTLLLRFPVTAPKVLASFLRFNLYEINGIAAALAEDLFHKGEQLLVAGEVFFLRPLQLYAITQQLRLAKPTCANGDAKADLGHILDFTCRLRYLKIPGTKGTVGTSNIQENLLSFDLSVFKSLVQIEISDCDSHQINGLPSLKPTLTTLSVHQSTASMKEIIVPEASVFAHWEPEGVDTDCPVTAIIPIWKMLTTLDMSHNQISCIDESVKLIPQVEFLDLSYNDLSLVENLQHLYNLIHLDMSYNKLTVLEGVHTKLGNIKTLNLAGNQLETLSGLSKLYSLVNLDISFLHLSDMLIMPDYRTKVLAQFWDRASEVCLDSIATTEKELDTVEVLKAIQKAKEVKDRMANNEKKISEDSRQSVGGGASSSSSSSSLAAPPRSPSLSHSASSSQGNHVCIRLLGGALFQSMSSAALKIANIPSLCSSCCCCMEDGRLWTDNITAPVLPHWLLSFTTANQDFGARLSALISREALGSKGLESSLGETQTSELSEQTVLGPGDGYFEMGPDCGKEGSACTASSSSSPTTEHGGVLDFTDGEASVRVSMVMWSHCIRVNESVVQRACCLVATDCLLAIFHTRTSEQPATVGDLVDNLETDLIAPYDDVEIFTFEIPDTCLSLKVRSSPVWFHFLADSPSLRELYTQLSSTNIPSGLEPKPGYPTIQHLIRQFLNSWESEEKDSTIRGGYAAHLLDPAAPQSSPAQQVLPCSRNPKSPLHPMDILSYWCPTDLEETSESEATLVCLPCILILTPRHLCVMKVDFVALASRDVLDAQRLRSCCRLTRIPLASVLLNPRQGCPARSSHPAHRFRESHVLELMAGCEFVTAVFALPHDKFLFLQQFGQNRADLRDIKTIAFLEKTGHGHLRTNHCVPPPKSSQNTVVNIPPPDVSCFVFCFRECFTADVFSLVPSVPQGLQRPQLSLSLLYPAEALIQKLSEENQCPAHLTLSPSLRYLSTLGGEELLDFFHSNIAEVEKEELKHMLWSSVVFYKSPDMEMAACIVLSSRALYFILDDTASSLKIDFIVSYCFAVKLSDLQSVNVGLFDQYFRVQGPSADHIISCLSRDSYGTHNFLQQLMTVLSLLEKVPSPEPSEQDIYTQFGNKSTGKMENYELVHSSKVKFVYPSEEEIGDLTFIVAERKGPQGVPKSFNILLYLLVFQVQQTVQSPPVLQPKTLILTSTDIFLLDEDYISYPLPDFAKEPPQRDKYSLTDARRIRDLDRVLMGYQTYPQALTLVFDDVPGPDLLCHLTMDHFSEQPDGQDRVAGMSGGAVCGGGDGEVQWCVFVPAADSRERLISLLARQWETLCSRELPVELTG